MNANLSFEALRRANPRAQAGFSAAVDDAAAAVKAAVAADHGAARSPRRLGLSAAAAASAVVAAITAFVVLGSVGGGPGVESATAAFRQAATVTAASAERSGTATVRITHDGGEWASSTIRWHGDDVSISRDSPARPGEVGDEMRVVDGVLFGLDHHGDWMALGSPRSIVPDSGTTPDEYIAAVREDLGGVTLQRFMNDMSGLTKTALDDGSSIYRGTVAAGILARETGFKEGQPIRVLPFGYVAHDEAADPASRLDVTVSVGAEGVVRQIAVTWGTWAYTVTYSELGTTAAPVAPPNAPSLEALRRALVDTPTP
jgi:hypothetical protein